MGYAVNSAETSSHDPDKLSKAGELVDGHYSERALRKRLLNTDSIRLNRLLSAPFSERISQLSKVRHMPSGQLWCIVSRNPVPWLRIADSSKLWKR